MTLARYAASVPAGVLPLPCLELAHPLWLAPHRRVVQPDDWTVTIDSSPVTFPGWINAGPWLSEFPADDETARARRVLTLDDVDGALLAQIEAVAEDATPVAVRLWLFRSDMLTVPLIAERYTVQGVQPQREQLDIECVSTDLAVIADPHIRHTRANSPGLRGR